MKVQRPGPARIFMGHTSRYKQPLVIRNLHPVLRGLLVTYVLLLDSTAADVRINAFYQTKNPFFTELVSPMLYALVSKDNAVAVGVPGSRHWVFDNPPFVCGVLVVWGLHKYYCRLVSILLGVWDFSRWL